MRRADRARVRNFRVPRANLEGVYAAGPVGSPYLYGKDYPRNDTHLYMSQMTVSSIALHNRLVDRLRDDGVAELDL